MKISFVIPAYNEENYIADCLQSVLHATADKPYLTEIVVVNNASTDRTAEIARQFPGVCVVDESRKGLTRARQKGFESTTGELIANIDSDVRLPIDWLDKAFAEFERCPELVCLSGPFVYHDLSLLHRLITKMFYGLGFIFYRLNRLFTRRGAMAQGGNFIVRRTSLQKIGGYDTNIAFFGEDTDIARRMSHVGRVEFTFRLWVYTSGRRLKTQGVVRTGLKYALNYFWVLFFREPLHKTYTDLPQ
ncbi:MAG: glycosyltransferase family A protein [Candidatus Kaiserbacteria bacterium]|nr:glycosyltransferase family A protein [Candidatus Kaiserbacteria bacterium]